jgi:hypothetical protein
MRTSTGATTCRSTSSSTATPAPASARAITGWTALVALLLQYGGNLCFDRMPAATAEAEREVAPPGG